MAIAFPPASEWRQLSDGRALAKKVAHAHVVKYAVNQT
jgi:hypothetical protein